MRKSRITLILLTWIFPLQLCEADQPVWIDLTHELSGEAVGIDTASIDKGKSTHFDTHFALMSQNVPVFENVANLDKLPPTGVYVIALPVKIRGGSGGPLRIIARVQKN